MKNVQDIKNNLAAHTQNLIERYKIREMGIFGSYVKNQQSKDSDADILVDFEEVPTLFDFVGLRDELSDILGIRVDLVMKSALKPRIRKRILDEVVLL